MTENLFECDEMDFSADDKVADPLFRPQKICRKRKVTDECIVNAKERRLDANFSLKVIFKSDFYTDFVKVSENSKETTKAKCVTCGRQIKGFGDISSNFVTHIKLKHADMYIKYRNYKLGNSEQSSDGFNKKVLNFIVDASLPISVVDRQTFASMFEGTGLKPMCRQTAMKKLEDYYQNECTEIKADISAHKFFCTTADIWSGNQRSFFGYTCHWLTTDFQRKSAALACRRFKGTHSAENIANLISEINASYGLNSKNIVLTVTDNGSNFVKAFRDHSVESLKMEEEGDDDDDVPVFQNDELLPKHYRCASHTLNLLSTTDLMKILKADESVFKKHKMVFNT